MPWNRNRKTKTFGAVLADKNVWIRVPWRRCVAEDPLCLTPESSSSPTCSRHVYGTIMRPEEELIISTRDSLLKCSGPYRRLSVSFMRAEIEKDRRRLKCGSWSWTMIRISANLWLRFWKRSELKSRGRRKALEVTRG